MDLVRKVVAERGMPVFDIPEPEPFDGDAPEELDLSGFGTVIFTSGFRPDYERWVHFPGAFDEYGFPVHVEGAGTVAPGLYFVGLDLIGEKLIEVNVTSPTGIQELGRHLGRPVEEDVIAWVEARATKKRGG